MVQLFWGPFLLAMFLSLFKPQILINFYSKSCMILMISISLTSCITKDLIIFIDFCWWFEMRWNEKGKGKRKQTQQAASSQQPAASQQYICQYKIQPIVPNTFSNKESIAQEDSLHNLVYFLYSIVWGGVINHFPTLNLLRGLKNGQVAPHPHMLEDLFI